MALLGNPFIANIPKQLSNDELAQALRVDIAGEYEAIIDKVPTLLQKWVLYLPINTLQ